MSKKSPNLSLIIKKFTSDNFKKLIADIDTPFSSLLKIIKVKNILFF